MFFVYSGISIYGICIAFSLSLYSLGFCYFIFKEYVYRLIIWCKSTNNRTRIVHQSNSSLSQNTCTNLQVMNLPLNVSIIILNILYLFIN